MSHKVRGQILGTIFVSHKCHVRMTETVSDQVLGHIDSTDREEEPRPLGEEVLTPKEGWEDQLNNDKVSVIAKFPQIPVGGRLSHFYENWKQITSDLWVLDLIQKGYKLEFEEFPPFLGIKHTKVPHNQEIVIEKEIKELLNKNAVEIVHPSRVHEGFYSTLFLVPKKNGEMRPVINLRPLNCYLRKQHFKMEHMSKVLNLVLKGDFAIHLDLKDGYFHLNFFKKHRKYLRFSFQGVVYQFRVMCFGPPVAQKLCSLR